MGVLHYGRFNLCHERGGGAGRQNWFQDNLGVSAMKILGVSAIKIYEQKSIKYNLLSTANH